MKICIIYTTIDSLEKAREIAKGAVQNKLAVCANIIPKVLSIYEWEGSIEENTEYIIIFKSSQNHVTKLEKYLADVHPYDTPAILKGSVGVLKDFYDYVQG